MRIGTQRSFTACVVPNVVHLLYCCCLLDTYLFEILLHRSEMSLIPFFGRDHPFSRTGDFWDVERLLNQDFDLNPFENDPFFRTPATLRSHNWLRPLSNLISSNERALSEVHNDENRFVVNVDVSHFSPEEIKVKVVDNSLIIEGKHEEKMDQHGFVSRRFSRRYELSKDVDMAQLTSNLTQGGVLHIEAPKITAKKVNERTIPIQFGPSAKHGVEHGGKGAKDVEQKK